LGKMKGCFREVPPDKKKSEHNWVETVPRHAGPCTKSTRSKAKPSEGAFKRTRRVLLGVKLKRG